MTGNNKISKYNIELLMFTFLFIIRCGGPDLNRRTPTGMDPESIAFNLARQPSPVSYLVVLLGYILIISAQLKASSLSVSFKFSDSEFSFCLFVRISSECYFNTCGIFHYTLGIILNTESPRLGGSCSSHT